MKQSATMREAGSMLKEGLLGRRVEKLARENDKLRDELDELKHDLDTEQERTKETLNALSKVRRRPGRVKWLVLAGGAYVLGAKAGRARYEQIVEWVRSVRRTDGNGSSMGSATGTGMTGAGTTDLTSTGSTMTGTGSTGTGSTGTTGTGSTGSTTTGSSGSRSTGSTSTSSRSTGTGSRS
jgi:hypothetical protein